MRTTHRHPLLRMAGLLVFATFAVACNASDAATTPRGLEGDSPSPLSHANSDGILRPNPAALAAFGISAVGDADNDERVMVPAVVALKDTAVSAVVSPIEGRVESLHVVEGQRVQKGELLATVRSPELINLKAELRGAQARLELAQDMMDRQLQLSADGVAVTAEVSMARSALSEAQSDVQRIRGVLRSVGSGQSELLSLLAERDGVVLSRNVFVGDAVGPSSDTLMAIGDPADLWLVAHVFERDLQRVMPDSLATIHLPGGVSDMQGTVSRVGAVVETSMRRAPVWLELDSVDGLRAGMMGQVSLPLKADSTLRLPPTAVLLDEAGIYRVWIEVEEGAFRAREVVVGQTRQGHVEVLSGLEPGERVVTKGALLLDASASMRL